MKNQYPPIVEKSLKVIEHLTEKFGWFTIRVYQFPLIPGFETFLESMQRNLTRHRLFSWYMWAKFKNKDMVLLVHFGRGFWTGHFESKSDRIIPSLWQRQSQLSYLMADTITVNHFDEFRNSIKNDKLGPGFQKSILYYMPKPHILLRDDFVNMKVPEWVLNPMCAVWNSGIGVIYAKDKLGDNNYPNAINHGGNSNNLLRYLPKMVNE
ncbi:MAG: hypothetical protein IKB25_03990 [Lentisphaeria bacterium]|nr:hypothetical protein [Lentisphaeria bacterium]